MHLRRKEKQKIFEIGVFLAKHGIDSSRLSTLYSRPEIPSFITFYSYIDDAVIVDVTEEKQLKKMDFIHFILGVLVKVICLIIIFPLNLHLVIILENLMILENLE